MLSTFSITMCFDMYRAYGLAMSLVVFDRTRRKMIPYETLTMRFEYSGRCLRAIRLQRTSNVLLMSECVITDCNTIIRTELL